MMKIVLLISFWFVLANSVYSQTFRTVYPKQSQVVSTNIKFVWNPIDSADAYNLTIASDASFSQVLLTQNTGQNFISDFNVGMGTDIYWRVIAFQNGVALDTTNTITNRVFTPASINELALWLKADTLITLTNNQVSHWGDLSDSLNNLVQTNGILQPTVIDKALNNFPVVSFDAFNDRFVFPFSVNKTNFLISSVYNVKEDNGRRIRVLVGSTGWSYGAYNGRYRVFNGSLLNGKTIEQDRYVVQTAISSNNVLTNYVNNVSYGTAANSRLPEQITLGADAINGNIAEMIVVHGSISDSIRSLSDAYLMDKYSPPVNLGLDRELCSFPDSIEFDLDYAQGFQWSNGDTTNKLVANSAGKYYLTITDMFERVSVDSITLYSDTNDYSVNLIEDTTICKGASIQLNAGGSELYEYRWSNGDSTSSITVDSASTYFVSVTNCLGNTSVDSVKIEVSFPAFSLGPDSVICFYDSVRLEPDTNFTVNYNWSTNSNNSAIFVENSGSYSLTVTDNFGCQFSDTVNVTSDSTLAAIDLGPDTSLCSGNSIGLLTPISGIDSYLWSTNATDSSIIVSSSQKYFLTVTENSCTAVDSVFISIKGTAPLAGFTTQNNCFGDSIYFTDTTLDVNGINLTSWKWKFGDGDSSQVQNPVHYYDFDELFLGLHF